MTRRLSIELHDSSAVIDVSHDVLTVRLCPAYIHSWECNAGVWIGRGLLQDATIRLRSADVLFGQGRVGRSRPQYLDCGSVETGQAQFTNLLPVDAEYGDGFARLRLAFASEGDDLEAIGQALEIRLLGEPEFCEMLPAEWREPKR